MLFSVLGLICFVIVRIVCLGDGAFVLVNGAVGAIVCLGGLVICDLLTLLVARLGAGSLLMLLRLLLDL